MSALDEARRLFGQGRQAEAVASVEAAADGGDSEALLALAHWRLFGLYGACDPALAQSLFAKAGAAGSDEALRTLAYLVGNGTGSAADPERAREMLAAIAARDRVAAGQLAFLDGMPSESGVEELTVETLSADPPVRLLRALLRPLECAYLIERAAPLLAPSSILDPSGRAMPHPVRTSSGMNFGPTEEDPVVHRLNRRIAAASGTDVECGEPLHILRYVPGQEFRPHVDALAGADNQRAWTMLVYLNAGYSGGETRFDLLGITTKGEAGDALLFRNAIPGAGADPRMRHAGLPVTEGVKWLASRWIRERPYDALVDRPMAY